ncbi:MAG: zinc ribbon domain-containing protein [Bacteroidia bacterium]
MKTCSSCGHVNPDEAKFCGKCGNTLSEPKTQVPPQTHSGARAYSSPTNASNPEPVSDELKWGIIIATIPFFPLGIIMGIIYMNDQNPQKKAVGKTWLWVGLGSVVLACYSLGQINSW